MQINKKLTVKQVLLLALIGIMFVGCNSRTNVESDKSQSGNSFVSDTVKQKADNALFSDESMSRFQIFSGDEDTGYDYKTIEVNYKVVFIIPDGRKELEHYIAKYTATTKTCTGCEGRERNIKVEIYSFEKPSKPVLTIDKNCDQIDLSADTYQTTVYGCYQDEDSYEIFDYKQKSIIQADNQIISGNIPNSKIKFYVGFVKDNKDTLCLGTLNLSYVANDKYAVKIRTRKNAEDNYLPFSPDIKILSAGPKDKFSESNKEYTFWSLNNVSDKNSINNLIIRLTFLRGGKTDGNMVVDIPIEHGKPFGKGEATQEIYIEE